MTDKQLYPQIPTSIWWGVREILIAKPSIQLTPKTISIQFAVQETAAKAYVRELQRAGLIEEDGKPTALALKWRNDDTYANSVGQILVNCYPNELLNALELDNVDREKAKKWFVLDGMGSGAAGNKAATLAMIASQVPGLPNSIPKKNVSPSSNSIKSSAVKKITAKAITVENNDDSEQTKQISNGSLMPLNVNVQIHISADSSNDQIEMIFKSMKKYLYHHDN